MRLLYWYTYRVLVACLLLPKVATSPSAPSECQKVNRFGHITDSVLVEEATRYTLNHQQLLLMVSYLLTCTNLSTRWSRSSELGAIFMQYALTFRWSSTILRPTVGEDAPIFNHQAQKAWQTWQCGALDYSILNGKYSNGKSFFRVIANIACVKQLRF